MYSTLETPWTKCYSGTVDFKEENPDLSNLVEQHCETYRFGSMMDGRNTFGHKICILPLPLPAYSTLILHLLYVL